MKSIFFLSIFLLFSKNENCSKNSLKCSDFKSGKFELVNSKSKRKYIIKRNSEFQTEDTYALESGKKISGPKIFKIRWINDCEYNLMIDTIKNKCDETDLYMNSKGGLNVKIIKVENNCATLITSLEDMKVESKLCKIK
ncbi:MAG: hypothetical protein H7239_04300 [Flavobacterium sp.]|nr:hypothetical protein [Flavobacterium sp.]